MADLGIIFLRRKHTIHWYQSLFTIITGSMPFRYFWATLYWGIVHGGPFINLRSSPILLSLPVDRRSIFASNCVKSFSFVCVSLFEFKLMVNRGVRASERKSLKWGFVKSKKVWNGVLWRAKKSEIRLKSELSHPWVKRWLVHTF